MPFVVDFNNKEAETLDLALALAQKRDKRKYTKKTFVEKATMRYSLMLIELEKKQQ
jgi:hypothetical protein